MKNTRLLLTSYAALLVLASCDKSRPAAAGAVPAVGADDLAAERALIEEERIALERQRLEEERMTLDEEKEALRAEREARLAAREQGVESTGLSLEERQRQLEVREFDLSLREDEFATREAGLSDRELELAGRDILDDWEPAPLPEMQEPVADYETFYEDLQPYGSWYETLDYGYVYQPTVVVRDSSWRPYTRGRWACTNLGWNWVSDEPFGWACFHYGRWALLHGRGWVWVPGDEWAPSWVCWREGSEHVGWAPLPPETLCYRGRGWDHTVEAEFGIGSHCFSFVHRRHMADPLWRHCLPVEQNARCIGQTNNITNIRFHQNRFIAGGPGYDRLRRDVGKSWPVFQIKTDRFEAIRDLNQRNASTRGNQLAVFAPNLNARWNDRLKPSSVAGRWDDVKVVRAASGIKPQWSERFRETRAKLKEDSAKAVDLAGKQQQLEENRNKVGEAQGRLREQQQRMTEARREKQILRREVAKESARQSPVKDRPAIEDTSVGAEKNLLERTDREPSLAERQRLAAQRLRESRARRTGTLTDAVPPAGEKESGEGRLAKLRENLREREMARNNKQPEVARPQLEKSGVAQEQAPADGRKNVTPAGGIREPIARVPQVEVPVETGTVAGNEHRARIEEASRQEQKDAIRQREQATAEKEQGDQRQREQARTGNEQGKLRQAMEEKRLQQQEQTRQRQEQAREQAEESDRRTRMDAVREQQQREAERAEAEQARGEQAERQREMEIARARQVEEARARQMEEAKARQEQARREAEEGNRRQQQEEMRRQQQEQARQQQEERARQQQEERARQQEQMRQQQEEARRQAEERSRQQQEERARQQEQARQQQEERARQQEQARQQQEERARQQEQSRQEEQQRRQEERAREQQERQEQSRQRGR